jgi:dipeptidyl aminopeptidase/acylaminoacyl peptidase
MGGPHLLLKLLSVGDNAVMENLPDSRPNKFMLAPSWTVRFAITLTLAVPAAVRVAVSDDTEFPKFKFSQVTPNGERKDEQSATSPDKRIRIEISTHGETALLYDAKTNKPFGQRLDARPWKFTCCTFTPDGKYVVMGSRYDDERDSIPPEEHQHLGRIEFWDAATGKPARIAGTESGPIKWIACKPDGKTIEFEAERQVSSGK